MAKDFQFLKFGFVSNFPNLLVLFLVTTASLILAFIGWLTWHDITEWSKDLGTIFFGARTGEAMSLGIGMKTIHYLTVSLSLFGAATVLFLRNRRGIKEPEEILTIQKPKISLQSGKKIQNQKKNPIKVENARAQEERFFSGCLHHFGYLSSRPTDSPIPQECIICQRLGDCMVATVYVSQSKK